MKEIKKCIGRLYLTNGPSDTLIVWSGDPDLKEPLQDLPEESFDKLVAHKENLLENMYKVHFTPEEALLLLRNLQKLEPDLEAAIVQEAIRRVRDIGRVREYDSGEV